MPADKTKAQHLQANRIKLIKMGQAQLGLDDDTYRDMLAMLCGGKTSAKALTWQEAETVIKHMQSRGFVIKRSAASGRAWDDGLGKLRAIWYALAEVGAVQRPANAAELDAAIEAWAKRMLVGVDAMRFLSRAQMQRLIEAAKKWAARVGAPDETDQAMAERRRIGG